MKKKITITKWGKKALEKAKNACRLLKIDYLWMDQLCIDQTSIEEQNQEVPKMGSYYGQAELTLISINADAQIRDNKSELAVECLKKIINSEWFSRSWTYQEGLLSKQTVFVFDDGLVDGRTMVQVWEMLGQIHTKQDGCYSGLNDNPKKFATPIGWTCFEQMFSSREKISLGLYDALKAVKDRKRGMLIDGIYSILGLLSYGDKVKVEYKPKTCPECPEKKEIEGCRHEYKNKQRPIYTKEDLAKALLEVIKKVDEKNSFNPLGWFGQRRSEAYLWQVPEIDENGSFDIKEINDIDFVDYEIINFSKDSVKLIGSKYVLKTDCFGIKPLESESENVVFLVRSENHILSNEFQLESINKLIKLVKEGDCLVLVTSKKNLYKRGNFGILVPNQNNKNCPVIVMRLSGLSLSEEIIKEELLIDMVNKKVIEGKEEIAQYETQIEANTHQK